MLFRCIDFIKIVVDDIINKIDCYEFVFVPVVVVEILNVYLQLLQALGNSLPTWPTKI